MIKHLSQNINSAKAPSIASSKVNVLVIDDSPVKIKMLKAIIEDIEVDINIDCVSSGYYALDKVLTTRYELILLDVNMPGMNGFETAQLIRSRRKSRDIPLIFITSDTAQDADLYDGYSLGAADFITSPINPEMLKAKIRVFIKISVMRDDLMRSNEALNEQLVRSAKQSQKLRDANIELSKSRSELVELTRKRTVSKMYEDVAKDLSQLISTANAPIIGVNKEGKVNEWNKKAELITGTLREVALGLNFIEEFVHQDSRAEVTEVINRAYNNETTENYSLQIKAQQHRYVELLFNCAPRRDSEEQIIGVIGIGQDVSELRETQMQLIQASKLASLGEMSTGVAHELNQPLNIIRMAASNMKRKIKRGGKPDFEYLEKKLTRIEEQVSRAAAIIDHMRMFGRSANESDSPVDINRVINDSIEMLKEQYRLEQIKIELELATSIPKVMGHQIKLEQVIINLLNNARDAYIGLSDSSIQSIISVKTQHSDREISIYIQDYAGGIPENIIQKIFDPFFTTKEVGTGTGLGLSVSYGIIRDMNGKLTVENRDGGARFCISLPNAEIEVGEQVDVLENQ